MWTSTGHVLHKTGTRLHGLLTQRLPAGGAATLGSSLVVLAGGLPLRAVVLFSVQL
ncbi:hypothetical protein [Nonomuraea basaltis]|uniref:hypothetical protein n=1 Tax=Nonomuraea basaltis TaxID=2495887 RepID=UPI001F113179|nr:hypothetical protein [Nonomuraea basaltis]